MIYTRIRQHFSRHKNAHSTTLVYARLFFRPAPFEAAEGATPAKIIYTALGIMLFACTWQQNDMFVLEFGAYTSDSIITTGIKRIISYYAKRGRL